MSKQFKLEPFKIGDRVAWESQSHGSMKTKVGTVVAINPPNGIEHVKVKWGLIGSGYARDHQSYIVAVKAGKTDKAKPKHYWPRVSALRLFVGDEK
jgi:hypothetical protein